jgi:hypothetical protein
MKDPNYPYVPAWLFSAVMLGCAAMLVLLLTACAGTPTVTEVKVAVPVECKEQVPDRPAMPTEQFSEKPALDQYVRAARAEIERREGFEQMLVAALKACTAPVK